MIFNSNTTSLGSSIPMAEGYDCSCGVAQALIESARNDYQMFRAMLDIDARELQIQRESSGVMRESQMNVLTEAALSGIWQKIKELFSKLVAKIKAIAHTFMSKINSLFMSDKQMVKKYEKELYRKSNLDNMEIKNFTMYDPNAISNAKPENFTEHDYAQHKSDINDRRNYYLPDGVDFESFEEDMDSKCLEYDKESGTLKDFNITIRDICNDMSTGERNIKDFNREVNTVTKDIDRLIKEIDRTAKDLAKQYTSDESVKDDLDKANKLYDMATAYQDDMLKFFGYFQNAMKVSYKSEKAIFMKAIAANDKKLAESTYLDAIAEAAEQEVDDVISSALSKEELSKINNASLNVMDADVSDDADKLTYGPDKYTDDIVSVKTAGTVDTEINSKEESAFFGKLFY